MRERAGEGGREKGGRREIGWGQGRMEVERSQRREGEREGGMTDRQRIVFWGEGMRRRRRRRWRRRRRRRRRRGGGRGGGGGGK